jgi:hypothetical protein
MVEIVLFEVQNWPQLGQIRPSANFIIIDYEQHPKKNQMNIDFVCHSPNHSELTTLNPKPPKPYILVLISKQVPTRAS